MRMFRRLINDGFCGGPLAAVIAVLMAMQALVGGFGSGMMALASPMEMVICSSNGSGEPDAVQHHTPDHRMHDHGMDGHDMPAGVHDAMHGQSPMPGDGAHSGHDRDCCLTACQISASIHVGIPANAPGAAFAVAPRPVLQPAVRDIALPQAYAGTGHHARAPPASPA